MLCTAGIVLFASEAGAQCSARDVLQNHLMLKKIPSANMPPILIRSVAAVPVWKTIAVGTFADSFTLRNALDAAGCGIGDSAGEILARAAFTVSATKADVGLIAVLVAELGFQTGTASLADIYARARQLGFELAAAEVAPHPLFNDAMDTVRAAGAEYFAPIVPLSRAERVERQIEKVFKGRSYSDILALPPIERDGAIHAYQAKHSELMKQEAGKVVVSNLSRWRKRKTGML